MTWTTTKSSRDHTEIVYTLISCNFSKEAFHHLHQQIVDLGAEYFQDTMHAIPSDVAVQVPEPMLSCLSSPNGSARLRAAFIEHIISSILTRRIFKPFLFTLSLRQEATDQLFLSWSDHMRSKSTRKEALWRQRTLHAAYTVASAKQSINQVAGIIVDEIIDAIKCFAPRVRLEEITVAVRRIVKTAAETWRYARLEIPMITASMLEEERPSGTKSKASHDQAHVDTPASGRGRQVLLPLFPIIEREAIHEDMREDLKMHDEGCIYFPGRMLYVDDPEIINSLNMNRAPRSSASLSRRDSADGQRDIEKVVAHAPAGDYQPTAHPEPTRPLSNRSSGEWPLSKRASASPARWSDMGDVLDVKSQAECASQVILNPSRNPSSPSSGLAPSLRPSSVTSDSSMGKSTSTTQPRDLPNWASARAGIFG